ncbi:MAG: tetratricopeptide repeat protein [Planctomycetes bacterium]|nr:tetratricopeptide repeat protein [Planctomycetota bacterium]
MTASDCFCHSVGRPAATGRVCVYALTTALLWFAAAALVAQDQPSSRPAANDPQRATRPLAEFAGVPAPPAQPGAALGDDPTAREHCEAAQELMDDDKYAQAVAALDEALNVAQADYYEVFYLMAEAKYRLRRLGEARTAAEYAARLRPAAADVHFLLGQLYEQQDRLERAAAHYRSATLAAERELNNPRVTAAWYHLGRCLVELGYTLAAAEAYERFDLAIWDTHPEHRSAPQVAPLLTRNPYGAVELCMDLYRRLDRPQDVVRVAARAAKARPDEPHLARQHVRALLDTGRPADALAICQTRLRDSDANSAFLPLALEAAQAAGQLDAWLGKVERGLAEEPNAAQAIRLARRLGESGAHANALRLWTQIQAQWPDDAGVAWFLANAQKANGDLRKALQTLIDFVRRHPAADQVPYGRLDSWMTTPVATDEFATIVAEWGQRPDRDFAVDFVLGTTAAAAGQPALAEELFRAALEAKPDFAAVRVAWAQLLVDSHRWQAAQEHAAAVLAELPDLGAAHFIMATTQAGLDQNDEADRSFKEALRCEPDVATYAVAYAEHCQRVGNLLGAQRYFQQALTVDPRTPGAAEGLLESYLGDGKVEIAAAHLKKAEAFDLPEDVLRRMRTSMRFVHAPFQDEHLAELARQFDEHPNDIYTGMKLGAGWYLKDRPEEAYRVTERVLALAPTDERAATLMARVQGRRLEYARAVEILESLTARYPNRLDLLALLAESHLSDFQLVQARATLRRILALDLAPARTQEFRTGLLRSYTAFSEFEPALRLLDEWIDQYAASDHLIRQKLGLLILAERRDEALKLARARLDAEPQERVGEFVDLCLAARAFKAAEEEVRKLLEAAPGNVLVAEWLVNILLEDQRADEALALVNEFERKNLQWSQDLAWRVLLGRCQAARGHLDDALGAFDSVLDERSADANLRAQAREAIVLTLMNAEQYERALEYCEHWLQAAGKSDVALRFEALRYKRGFLQAAGRDEEYAELTETMLALTPYEAGLPPLAFAAFRTGLNNDLGYTWVDAGQNLERATQMIRSAVADQPLHAQFLDSLGWAYYKRGEFSAARRYLDRATRLREGQDAVIYSHLGDAAYHLGDHNAARRHWEKALDLLSEPATTDSATRPAELTATLRSQLAAMERGEQPRLAPLAVERR